MLGKLTQKKNTKTETIVAKRSEEANIVWTYSMYDLKANDVIAGEVPKNIDMIFAGSEKPQDIEMNKDYVFFLEKDMLGGDSYHLLSYSEGVFEVEKNDRLNNDTEDKNVIFMNKKTGVQFDKDILFKESVKTRNKGLI